MPGDTLAAALARAGITTLRSPGDGSPGRGLFCGMGVCQDCLVTVDGVADRRACMTDVVAGMRVESGLPQLKTPACAAPASPDVELASAQTPAVLVVGAGPAGLRAALAAAEGGVEVVLLDERKTPGGQYFKQPRTPAHVAPSLQGDVQTATGRTLIQKVRDAGVSVYSDALVWGCESERGLIARVAGELMRFEPEALIVAAGAYERVSPFPGWTLPGVMTAGAAQTLLRTSGTLPGRRVLMAGNGPLNLQVAVELASAGAEVVAICEAAAPGFATRAGAFLSMLRTAPDLAWQGLRLVARCRRQGLPVLSASRIVAVSPGAAGLSARVRDFRAGTEQTFDCDVVCLGDGFLPNNELLRLLGCRHEFDAERGHLVTVRDAGCMTSIDNVYAIGDCCGLSGARAAMHEGDIAAATALQRLGAQSGNGRADAPAAARRRLDKARRFQKALWQYYAPAPGAAAALPEASALTDEMLLCRCELVTLGAVRSFGVHGRRRLDVIKRATRIGMGACQGRYCLPAAVAILEASGELRPGEFILPAAQMPLRPLSANDLLPDSSA